MKNEVSRALDAAITLWNAMSRAESGEAEEAADGFEHSFYTFIEAVREWYHELETKPHTLDEALALPEVQRIIDRLPEPLHLNFETELELILEDKSRIDDAKYD